MLMALFCGVMVNTLDYEGIITVVISIPTEVLYICGLLPY